MRVHVRCSFCHELLAFEPDSVPLDTETFGCCRECWHKMQDYLTESGFTILGSRKEPK